MVNRLVAKVVFVYISFFVLLISISFLVSYVFNSLLNSANMIVIEYRIEIIVILLLFALILYIFMLYVMIKHFVSNHLLILKLQIYLYENSVSKSNDSHKMSIRVKEVFDYDFLLNEIIHKINSQVVNKQAELSILQNNINPHFLYNTLDSIRGFALVHKEIEIAVMTKALADIFRYSISTDEKLISLKEELENIDNYLKIENFRFSNKFIITKNICEKALNNKIPKLLVQPLVENSLKHGLEMKKGRGEILIESYLHNDYHIIRVIDNGLGMDSHKLEIVLKKANNLYVYGAETTSIGLANVNARIKATFGDNYGLNIYSSLNVGTTVELLLPKQVETTNETTQFLGEDKSE